MVADIFTLKDRLIYHIRQCLQGFFSHPVIPEPQIGLHLLRGQYPITYQSAIAHRLTTQFNQPAITIATQIVDQIQSKSTEFFVFPNLLKLGGDQAHITSNTMPSGMILLELTDTGVANWLHYMTNISAAPGKSRPRADFPNDLFDIQYSHARCCSLLRRAHQDGLITLTSPHQTLTQPNGQWCTPHPLPWLTLAQQLQLTHTAEHLLIAQLIMTMDCYSLAAPPPNWTQLAHDLSRAFQQFYQSCQIWGAVKQQTPLLAQTRLGLVWITQKLLCSILQEQLNIIAPFEL
ncbi:MAG: DALR anticodon-binding domain-containing protein [Microcoleaceae cyanobacterium]